jgi:hypothetical protein
MSTTTARVSGTRVEGVRDPKTDATPPVTMPDDGSFGLMLIPILISAALVIYVLLA